MVKSSNQKTKGLGLALLGACILFYLAFYFLDGIQLCKDSEGYINMDMSREPLYPTFLAMFRMIFGEALYLHAVVIAQCVLAGYAMWKLADMGYQYSQSKWILPGAIVFFQVVVALINRFVAMRQAIYANEIATEGVTFALYTMFFVQTFLYFKEEKKKNLLAALVLAALMVSARKQMLIAYGVLFFLVTMRKIGKVYRWKKYFVLLGLLAVSFASTKLIENGYYYSLAGAGVERTRDSSYFLVTTLYTAKEGDAALLTDPETKELFSEMWKQQKEQKLNLDNAEGSWSEIALHYGNSYDAISYGVAYPTIDRYIAEHYQMREVEAGRKFDFFGTEISNTLMKENFGRMMQVFFANALMGCVNTVANMKGILIVYSFFVYLLFIACSIFLWKKKKQDSALLAAEITFFSVFTNVSCVAITIFAQPRYMIYNMAFFYMVLVWMGYNLLLEHSVVKWKWLQLLQRIDTKEERD